MEILLASLIKKIILPPGLIFFGFAIGYLLARRWKALGRGVVLLSLALGYSLTLPIVSGTLASITETYPPIKPDDIQHLDGEAIVILAGGKDTGRAEYGGVTVSMATLERIRYGAILERELKLPVLVSGGTVSGSDVAEADLMAEILEKEFFVTPGWVEKESRNTAQNAFLSAELLPMRNIILITNALHMPRSVRAFERAGFKVTAAPVLSVGPGDEYHFSYKHFLPSEKALVVSHDALHEWYGLLWYSIRY